MHLKKRTLKNLMLVSVAGFILCFMGFYNNFPLFHWDSAVYIFPSFQFYVPKDRPVIYGFFLRLSSLNYTLWLTILTQGVVLALSVFYYFKYLISTMHPIRSVVFAVFIILISFFTNASIHVSLLLPDIFTSIAILNFGLLIFVRNFLKRDFVIISLMMLLSLCVHNSHLFIILFLLFILTVLFLIKKIRVSFLILSTRRLAILWFMVVFSYLSSATVHYMLPRTGEWVYGHFFSAGQGGHVFLMSKMNQTGILKDYLDKNCKYKNYTLCQYKDSIPPGLDFMWKNYSPLYKTGGWHANKDEYNTILLDILTTPEYLTVYAIKSFELGFVQFFSFDAVPLPVLKNWHFPDSVVRLCYPAYENEYQESLQNKNLLNQSITESNLKQQVFFPIALILLILLFALKFPLKYKVFGIYILIALFLNALVCSSLSAIDSRYQSRVLWLLLLPIALVAADKEVLKEQYFVFMTKIKSALSNK